MGRKKIKTTGIYSEAVEKLKSRVAEALRIAEIKMKEMAADEVQEEKVEKILCRRFNTLEQEHEYLVKWKNCSSEQSTWKLEMHFEQCWGLIDDFNVELYRQEKKLVKLQQVTQETGTSSAETPTSEAGNSSISPERPTGNSASKATNQVEMSEKFESKLQDVDDTDKSSDESDKEAGQQMRETEDGTDKLRDQLWGDEDGENDEKDGDGDIDEEQGEESNKDSEPNNELDMSEKQNGHEENGIDADDENSENKRKQNEEEIDEIQELEIDGDQVMPYHTELEELPVSKSEESFVITIGEVDGDTEEEREEETIDVCDDCNLKQAERQDEVLKNGKTDNDTRSWDDEFPKEELMKEIVHFDVVKTCEKQESSMLWDTFHHDGVDAITGGEDYRAISRMEKGSVNTNKGGKVKVPENISDPDKGNPIMEGGLLQNGEILGTKSNHNSFCNVERIYPVEVEKRKKGEDHQDDLSMFKEPVVESRQKGPGACKEQIISGYKSVGKGHQVWVGNESARPPKERKKRRRSEINRQATTREVVGGRQAGIHQDSATDRRSRRTALRITSGAMTVNGRARAGQQD